MINAAIAVLGFALLGSAVVSAGQWLNYLRAARTINRRLQILARSGL